MPGKCGSEQAAHEKAASANRSAWDMKPSADFVVFVLRERASLTEGPEVHSFVVALGLNDLGS